jgi:hypothetical protein
MIYATPGQTSCGSDKRTLLPVRVSPCPSKGTGMQWFRFYSEALEDPKVQRLPAPVFKTWVNLLCLASKSDAGGVLPSPEDCAFALRMDLDTYVQQTTELLERGLIDAHDDHLSVHNWEGRQKRSDNVTARVHKHREQKQQGETFQKRSGNGLEKNRVEKSREEEIRGESAGADAPPAARVAPPQKAPRVVKHPLPADFPLTPERRAWLQEHRPDLDAEMAHDEFCTYWRSVRLEERGKKTDWEMTWQNGMLRSRMVRAPARASPNGYQGKPSATEGFAAIAARFKREADDGPGDLSDAIDVPFAVREAHRRPPPRGA